MQLPRLILSLCLLTCLAGCSRDSWLHGKWTFDREYTEAQLSKEANETVQDKSVVGFLKPMVTGMIVPMLIEKLDGMTYIISQKEMILTSKGGSGRALTYEIVERPTKDSWLIKTSDGKVETYYREGERLVSSAGGDVHFKVYFKRASR